MLRTTNYTFIPNLFWRILLEKSYIKIAFLIIVLIISYQSLVTAQVSYDNNGFSENCVNCGDPYTKSNFTIPAGTNRIVIVELGWVLSWSPSSITYNGQALTQAVAQWESNYMASEIWYLVLGTGNAITGDLVVNMGLNYPALNTTIFISSFQNVDQSNPIANVATQRVNSNNITTSITSSPNNKIVDCLTTSSNGTGSFSLQAGQTQLFQNKASVECFGSYKSAATGSTSMTWTGAINVTLLHSLAELNHDGVTFLPVELTYFKGENIDNQNKLTWQTASEQNNKGFYIERSENGTDWEAIGFVQGNGTTTEVSNYEFVDNLDFPSLQDLESLNYYRLKQTDFDGKYEYSNIIQLAIRNPQLVTCIFPNPVKGNNVNIQIENEETQVSIFTNSGTFIRTIPLSNGTNQIDIEDLPTGIYFLNISSKGHHSVEKLIKY